MATNRRIHGEGGRGEGRKKGIFMDYKVCSEIDKYICTGMKLAIIVDRGLKSASRSEPLKSGVCYVFMCIHSMHAIICQI